MHFVWMTKDMGIAMTDIDNYRGVDVCMYAIMNPLCTCACMYACIYA